MQPHQLIASLPFHLVSALWGLSVIDVSNTHDCGHVERPPSIAVVTDITARCCDHQSNPVFKHSLVGVQVCVSPSFSLKSQTRMGSSHVTMLGEMRAAFVRCGSAYLNVAHVAIVCRFLLQPIFRKVLCDTNCVLKERLQGGYCTVDMSLHKLFGPFR